MIYLLFAIAALLVPLVLFSYLDRIYRERGKFLDREFQDNLDVFDNEVEPRLKQVPERIQLAVILWLDWSLAWMSALTAVLVVQFTSAGFSEWFEAALFLVAVLVVGNRLIPYLLFARTRGRWLLRWVPLLRIAFLLMTPVIMAVGFCVSLASLSQPTVTEDPEEKRESEIEALMEAGQEEGIIEEGDRDLVQSALEFGDKRVREIMVPRPDIVAVSSTTTLEELRALVRQRHFSRIPVYQGDIDHIVGVVQTHDLLHVPEEEMSRRTVAERLRAVLFVPEAETTAGLLREMQQQGIHTAIIINEYGSVAGLVTLSDLLEQIVGELRDEGGGSVHAEWVEEHPGQFVVSGGLDLSRLEELMEVELDSREATTVAGYLAERLGRIPETGEHVQENGLEFEILEANSVRILRVRVMRAAPAPAASPELRQTGS